MRPRAIRWNRREARGGPGRTAARPRARTAATGAAAAAGVLALGACFGGEADRREADAPADEAAATSTGARSAGDGGWTNYVPLAPGRAESAPLTRFPATLRATCPVRSFRIVFDTDAGVAAILDARGAVLAASAPESHMIASTCREGPATSKRYVDEGVEPQVADESGGVACRSRRGIEVVARAISAGGDEPLGGRLVVSVAGSPTPIADAITAGDVGGRHLRFDPRYCRQL